MSEMTSIKTGKRPEEVSRSPSEWIRQNLFSNIPNTILTIIFGIFTLYAIRGILGFVLSGER